MLAIVQETRDPFFNLATEDFLLHERGEDFLILYVNDPSVVIGKHQVAHMEIDERNTCRDGINVLRRISGGGAVYHDHGNLNYTFIRESEKGKQVDFRLYMSPVIRFLESAGVNAEFGGKNDLLAGGLKISGNAEHVYRERVMHHGTLLFDASLGNMGKYLRPESAFYSTHAVSSNRRTVTNLKGLMKGIRTIDELISSMTSFFMKDLENIEIARLSSDEKERIAAIAGSKYRSWDWIWGYGPAYTFEREFYLSGIHHNCKLNVKDGIIRECVIRGSVALESAGRSLPGCRHFAADILGAFRNYGIELTEDEVYLFF